METDSSDSSSSLENNDVKGDEIEERSQPQRSSPGFQSPTPSSPRVVVSPEKAVPDSPRSGSNLSIIDDKQSSGHQSLSRQSSNTSHSGSSTGKIGKLQIRSRLWSSRSRGKNKMHALNVNSDSILNTQDHSSSPQSASLTFAERRTLFRSKRRSSGRSSGRTSPTITQLSPLLSSNIRLEKSFTFGASPVDQLISCFPDRNIRLFVVIWNMQEMKDVPSSLQDLLLPADQVVAADMYVIGTVESTSAKQEWEILVQKTLGPSYVLVQTAIFGVLYLLFFIRRDLLWYCSAVDVSSFATRPLITSIKTKGAVAITFSLFGSTFLFIVSHFAAQKEYVAERNSNMKRTSTNLTFNSISQVEGSDVTTKFDYVFWCGDFNYRVDMDRNTVDKILSLSPEVAIRNLLMEDQLTKEILQGNVFEGFSELPINFLPTYKYDVGTDNYDSSEKQRTPSWTDRVLFRSKANTGIWGIKYFSHMDMKCSDHKPVGAIFRVKLAPSEHMDSIPDSSASFNAAVYAKGKSGTTSPIKKIVWRTPLLASRY